MTELQHPSRPSHIGARLPRVEDKRLAAGRHRYVGDLHLSNMVDMAVVRSPYAHAQIRSVNAARAREAEGVLEVVSAADLSGVAAVPDFFDWARPIHLLPLSAERVRYVGAPVAAVVASNRYLAEDAVQLVEVEYEELPVVPTVAAALAPDAPRLYPDWPDNRMVELPVGSPDVEKAFAEAARIVTGTWVTHRFTGVPMEPRAAIARYEDDRLTLWSSTQFPHICRSILSMVLSMPERDIRVIAPDLGGGFGTKAEVYPEEFLVCWLAKKLGRPVRFIEDRIEHMVATGHSRDMAMDLEAAVDDEGLIFGLRGTITHDLGSTEIYPPAFSMALTAAGGISGPYRIPYQAVGITAVVTNKTPTGAYRGFGIPEAVFAMERLIDKVARETEADPVELRRRLIIQPSELPYESGAGAIIDSGSHLEAFDRVVEMGRSELTKAQEEYAHDPSVRIGLGFANHVDGVIPTYFTTTGNWTSQDSCSLRFDPDGGVTVSAGVHTMGQGLITMITMVTAEELGVALSDVRVVTGDTDMTPYGLGSWGSRSTGVFGGAFLKAADVIKGKARAIAARLLEADVEDVAFEKGRFHIVGSADVGVSWREVADVAYFRTSDLPHGVDPGLEATAWFDPPTVEHEPRPDGKMNACATYTNASHAAIVKVDIETGNVKVLKYLVTHDCGTLINPMIVEGQIQGGVAQGIGGALYEELLYDGQGQPMSTTFADYLLPTATEIPPIAIEHFQTPAGHLPFGAKGCGEAGVSGPSAAIASAVEDALKEFHIAEITRTPLSPPVVLRLLAHTEQR